MGNSCTYGETQPPYFTDGKTEASKGAGLTQDPHREMEAKEDVMAQRMSWLPVITLCPGPKAGIERCWGQTQSDLGKPSLTVYPLFVW